MKKILASCLTCCTLLGSMCFSSPMTQLHAMSTEGETGSTTEKFDHEIELNIREDITCEYNIEYMMPGSTLSIADNVDSTDPEVTYKCTIKGDNIKRKGNTLDFEIAENNGEGTGDGTGEEVKTGTITFESLDATSQLPKKYTIIVKVQQLLDPNPNFVFDLDLSKRKTQSKTENNNTTNAFYEESHKIVPTLTTAEVKPGDTFSLNLPEYFLSNKFLSTSLERRKNTESDFIAWDEITSNSSVTGAITADAEAGKTISFDLKVKLENMPAGMTDYNPTLVTYNSGTPGDPGDVNEELEPDEYLIPVEFKIVDDGKGDIIDEDEEYPVFLNLTPEYKKLTEKGETYKLDASVELDEDTDSEAKEYFEAMKKDGHFKVSFMSKNTDVATVSEDGTVTAVANGSTEIVAYVEGFEEDGLLATSKVDVEIAEKVEEEPEEADTTYPKTGDNFMAISAAILTLGISALVIALISKKQQQEDVNEEK